jgi:hypothetical protein
VVGAIFRYHYGYSHFIAPADATLEKAASLMGHSSLDTTRIYMMPGAQDLTLAVAAVED